MTEIAERLRTIRDHLRTGALGQREVWEEWLTEAAAEIDQLTGSKAALQTEIERLKADGDGLLYEELMKATADNARLLAALQEIEDFPYVGTQASQKIRGIARRAREPKP